MFVYKIKIPRAKSSRFRSSKRRSLLPKHGKILAPMNGPVVDATHIFFPPHKRVRRDSKKRREKSGDCAVGSARGARACDRSIVTRRVRRAYIGIFKIKIYVSLERGYLGKRKSDRGKKRLPRIHHVDFKFANIFASVVTTID